MEGEGLTKSWSTKTAGEMREMSGIEVSVDSIASSSSYSAGGPSHLAHQEVNNTKGQSATSDMLELASLIAHLTSFAIIGVLIRHGLEMLSHAIFFNDRDANSSLFLDLPTNMIGCFFMGWVGVVFKQDLWMFSKSLAEGLSVGLMGSITTFAAWNHKMIILATNGRWEAALFGYVIGIEVSQMSLLMGIESARLLKWRIAQELVVDTHHKQEHTKEGNCDKKHKCDIISLVVSSCLGVLLWTTSLILLWVDEKEERRFLWLACIVGPVGVWVRRSLATLNGRGVGFKLLWLPIGTLCANVLSVIMESSINVVPLMVKKDKAMFIDRGMRFGLLGCMSTMSSLVGEIYTMYKQDMHYNALAYAMGTVLLSFILGVLIYAVPAWTLSFS